MALTGRVIFSSYNSNGQDRMGTSRSFPSGLALLSSVPGGITVGQATCNSIVEILPTGLNQVSKKYYTPSSVADLASNGT